MRLQPRLRSVYEREAGLRSGAVRFSNRFPAMRTLTLCALLATATGLPAHAQQPFADSARTYVAAGGTLGATSAGRLGSLGLLAGRRLTPQLDLGLWLKGRDLTYGGMTPLVGFGPSLGYTRPLGRGFDVHARVNGGLQLSRLPGDARVMSSGRSLLVGAADVTVSRPLALGRGFSVAPVVGAYGSSGARAHPGISQLYRHNEFGALAGVDLRFKLLGKRVSLPLVLPLQLLGHPAPLNHTGVWRSTPRMGGIRISF